MSVFRFKRQGIRCCGLCAHGFGCRALNFAAWLLQGKPPALPVSRLISLYRSQLSGNNSSIRLLGQVGMASFVLCRQTKLDKTTAIFPAYFKFNAVSDFLVQARVID